MSILKYFFQFANPLSSGIFFSKQLSGLNIYFYAWTFFSFAGCTNLFAGIALHDGSISGRIVNQQGAPIDYGTIVLKNAADSSVVKIMLSSVDGAFTFKPVQNGSYLISAQVLGYHQLITNTIIVSESKHEVNIPDLVLVASKATELQQVSITAQTPFIERTADRTTINIQNSILSEGASMLEVMEKLPGIIIGPDGQIILNGNPQVNVYIDGRSTRLSGQELTNFLTGLASSNIQKVELIPKPSAKYEAAGSGGIINIVRKKGKKNGLNGTINGGFSQGRYSKSSGGGAVNFKNDVINLSVSENYMYNKGFRSSLATTNFISAGSLQSSLASQNNHIRTYKTHTPSIGVDIYLTPKTTLTISGNGELQTFNNKSNSNSQLNSQNLNNTAFTFLNISEDVLANYSSNAHLVQQVDTTGQELSLDIDLLSYNTDADQNIFNNQIQSGLPDVNTNILLNQDRELSLFSIKGDYVLPIKNKFIFETGFKSSRVSSKTDSRYFEMLTQGAVKDDALSNNFNYTEIINAGYVNIKKTISKMDVQLGIRAENTNGKGEEIISNEILKRNYFQLFPSALVTYKVNKNHQFTLNLSRRIDRPAYSSLNPLRRFINTTTYLQGNSFLRPQDSYNMEIGYSYLNALFMTVSYRHISNFMTNWVFADPGEFVTVSQPINIKSSTTLNFDLSYSKKINSFWFTNNNLIVFYPTFKGKTDGLVIANPKGPSTYMNSSHTLTLSSRYSADLGFLYIPNYQDGAYNYEPTYNLSFGLKRSILNNKGSISVNVNDALRSQGYASTITTSTINDTWKVKNDTRIVRLNLSYRFGKSQSKPVKKVSGAEEEKKRSTSN
ncbi:TonB-dependent receptor, putative [Arcticibacter svalbardensis MN12-7]|uniref:TonB-dependent receptor, putative n=1 Tax=Arcticibacter svalbardensis MN12-7 TaxID=1150600 RepID=R9H5A4_9SPHI|nr:outer membrane beta-barrel family protein [Arcticibacter svalbardensis]EOR96359.1 TonB-dependent receptor, putative [Arcticibacter svalbardensis MN12-7]